MEIDKNQRTNSYDDGQLLSETSLSSDCEMKADATSGNPTKISMNTDFQSQNSRKGNPYGYFETLGNMSESPCNLGMQKH